MKDDAVEILKEAMAPPEWWSNSARLTPSAIVDHLAERGYVIAPAVSGDAGAASAQAPAAGGSSQLDGLMSDLEANVSAARQERTAVPEQRRSA